MLRIGIDLGGTKIEIVALAHDGRELLRRRRATPRDDYPAVLAAVASLALDAERELGEAATIGVGTPGSISRANGLLRGSNSVCLNGKPIKADLEALLGREVRIANDANCFALSEAIDGAGAGAEIVFGVILGTGVGGGLVVRGQLLTGANAIAGEWGHNALPWPSDEERPGFACFAGHSGCIESFLSGPGLERDHRQARGEALTARELAARAAMGEGACDATLRRYEGRLARALAQVINIVDPNVIVLGGGLSNIDRLYGSCVIATAIRAA
jgi:fructokinase